MKLFMKFLISISLVFQLSQIFAHSNGYSPYEPVYLNSKEKLDYDVYVWDDSAYSNDKHNALVGIDKGLFFNEYVLHIHIEALNSEGGFEWREVYLDMFDTEAEKALNGTLDLGEYLRSEDIERQLEGFGIFVTVAGAVILCVCCFICIPPV